MDASEEILLNSLANTGVRIPAGVSSVRDLTPASLFSLCSNALLLIDGEFYASSFPTSLPEDSMPDKVKICTELAHAFNKLGYNPELSFQKFLYPSEDDLYKLVRFLVGKLSEDSRSSSQEILNGLNNLKLKTQAFGSSVESNSTLGNVGIIVEDSKTKEEQDFSPIEGLRKNASGYQGSCEGEVLKKPLKTNYSNFQHLEEELLLLKEASALMFDEQHPFEFHIEQLHDQLEAKRHKLKKLESEWDSVKKPLQEKKGNLEQALFSLHPEASGKLTRMKEVELETKSILAEIMKREEELSKLSSDLEKQPKMAPRRSYIERVNEITKNSRKQDNDIQQILKDTRELQLESNTIQERLHRTYAVVNETIFREGKKDFVARQAYKLLTNIHESFEQITEKILATDRTRRDAADYEAKLASISARSLNIGKLQADLDAIRKENELLEQRLL